MKRRMRQFLIAVVLGAWSTPMALGRPPESGGTSISFARAFFVSDGSAFGTALIWLLLGLSAVSLALAVGLFAANRRGRIAPPRLIEKARRASTSPRELDRLIADDPSDFSNLLRASLHELPHGREAAQRALERASDELILRRLRAIESLNVIGNVAPMIGLFGTVYGMILAFNAIVAAGGRPDPVDLAGGIGTALVTTFWGLVVAIPSLAAYAIIRNSAEAASDEAALAAGEIINSAAASPEGGPGRADSPPANRASSPIAAR